jgi:hypothetical protein
MRPNKYASHNSTEKVELFKAMFVKKLFFKNDKNFAPTFLKNSFLSHWKFNGKRILK